MNGKEIERGRESMKKAEHQLGKWMFQHSSAYSSPGSSGHSLLRKPSLYPMILPTELSFLDILFGH